MKIILATVAILLSTNSFALDIDKRRALYNYQLFCQGCHTPDGVGGQGVPRLKDYMGYFMKSEAGKAFLVRVPGTANSVLDDGQLAEVMNWMLLEFGGESLPDNWSHYTAEQVKHYRKQPLFEINNYRQSLLQ